MNVREWLVVPLVVGLIAWAGFALRAWTLDAQSLWWDEGFSLNLAGQSVGTIVRGDFHPPLYHLLLAGWTRVAGTTDFAARYFSVTCGTLLIPLAFSVGQRLFDQATGLVAPLLTAGSPVLLWYAQETWKEAGFTGIAQIEIGLYDPQTGDRVQTATGADHVILPTTVEVTE